MNTPTKPRPNAALLIECPYRLTPCSLRIVRRWPQVNTAQVQFGGKQYMVRLSDVQVTEPPTDNAQP